MPSIAARSSTAWWSLRGFGLLAAVVVLSGAAPGDGSVAIGPLAVGLGGALLLAILLVLHHRNRLLRARLAEVRRRFDDAFESMAEGLVLFDAEERLVCCNRRYLDCFPRTAWMRVPGARIADLRAAAIKFGEFKGVDPGNGSAWTAAQQSIYRDGGRAEYELADGRYMVTVTRKTPDGGRVVVWHDITDRKRLERELEHRATHDNLTGLPNRAMFRDELRRARARAERDGTELAVMLLDLDLFKEVNDTHGHAVGDELLAEVAQRLEAAVRAGDFVARLGGDEFAILAAWPAGTSQVESLAPRILQRLTKPLHLGRAMLRPSASIGVAVYPTDPSGAEQLLEHADRALYSAKAAGRGTWATLKAGKTSPRRPLMSGEHLVSAIERNELDLDYQPILAGDTLDVVGVEALVRWNHPQLGRLPARAFLPLAERSVAITALTRSVLGRALAQQRDWHRMGLGELKIWVNLAPRCVASDGLVDTVATALAQTGVPARQLVLELTEWALAGTRSGEANLAALRRLGVAIAIDDFGAGHSSLGRLKALPLDVLKIDRTLVSAVTAGERDRAIVRTIVALGASLGLATSAEGIETLDQLRLLRRLGCSLVQGYLFAQPMAGPHLSDWLTGWRSHARADLDAACRSGVGTVVGWSRPAA
jgi:diguanylate cyclase (GGDEF)-like protein